jgi:hypothetical protein
MPLLDLLREKVSVIGSPTYVSLTACCPWGWMLCCRCNDCRSAQTEI